MANKVTTEAVEWRKHYASLLNSKIDTNYTNSLNCSVWDSQYAVFQRYPHSPKYGKQKITLMDGSQKSERAHRLSFILSSGLFDLPLGYDVSHICHNTLCVKYEHLSLEPHEVNNSRQLCKNLSPQKCMGHRPFPDCLFAQVGLISRFSDYKYKQCHSSFG